MKCKNCKCELIYAESIGWLHPATGKQCEHMDDGVHINEDIRFELNKLYPKKEIEPTDEIAVLKAKIELLKKNHKKELKGLSKLHSKKVDELKKEIKMLLSENMKLKERTLWQQVKEKFERRKTK